MGMRASVGLEFGSDAYTVGANAAQSAIDRLRETPDLLLVFSSVKYDQRRMLQGVRSIAPRTLVVGASSAGEITTYGPTTEHSVVVMAIKAPDVKFFAGIGDDIRVDAKKAGRTAADIVKKKAGGNLRAFMMFPDVLTGGNGADIVRGVEEVLGANFPIVGGASADDFEFKKTYQYINDEVYSGTVVGLGLSGRFKMGIGVKHGWVPIGEPLTVTRSEGPLLHEVDGKPAIAIYEEYFGTEEAEALRREVLARLAITYPLGMKVADSDEMIIRDPITVDEHGSITCAAEIPEGTEIRLMVGNRHEAVRVAKLAAKKALAELQGSEPKAVIIFNSVARNKLLGSDASLEINAIQEVVGSHVPLVGFYTYGEQAPLEGGEEHPEKRNAAFHNETVVICVLGD